MRRGFIFALLGWWCSTHVAAEPLTPAQLLGQKIMLDLRYYCASAPANGGCRTPLTTLPADVAARLQQHHIGGVILFSENLVDAAQIQQLTQALQASVSDPALGPMLIAIDEEGGRVSRLPDSLNPNYPGNRALGSGFATQGTALAQRAAQQQAQLLRALGINVNFAPVLDVDTHPRNPVINIRSYSADPSVVAQLGAATVQAMQAEGVLAAVKHFPGHGDTQVDSHTGLPRVDKPLEALLAMELKPFRQVFASAPPAMVMTAHIDYPALGTAPGQPASLSPAVITGWLRQRLGYNGVIVSDALDMHAVSAHYRPLAAVLAAFSAGVDIALMPLAVHQPQDLLALDALMQQLHQQLQTLPVAEQQQWLASAKRILNAKQRLNGPGTVAAKTPSLSEARATAQRIAASALAFSWGQDRWQPPVHTREKWLVLLPDTLRCLAFEHAMRRHGTLEIDCYSLATTHQVERARQQIQALQPGQWHKLWVGEIAPTYPLAETRGLDPISQGQRRASISEQQALLTQALAEAKRLGIPTIAMALRSDHSLTGWMQAADIGIATHSYSVVADAEGQWRLPAFEALASALFQ